MFEKRDGVGRLGVKYRVPPAPTPPTVKCCDALSSSAAVISSDATPAPPRFALVISLLSLAALILPEGKDVSGSFAVEGLPRVDCFWGDDRPSAVLGRGAEVEVVVVGWTGWGAFRGRFRVKALRSMAGHKNPGYSRR
jgi:hypothetical protein